MKAIHHIAVLHGRLRAPRRVLPRGLRRGAPDGCDDPPVVRLGDALLRVFTVDELPPAHTSGHYHHSALEAPHVQRFAVVRERLITRGASDGRAIDSATTSACR